MDTSGLSYDTSLTLLNGFIHSIVWPCSRQNPSGSATERSYISRYFALSTCARSICAAVGANFALSDIGLFPPHYNVKI